jgi:hypothetical protein
MFTKDIPKITRAATTQKNTWEEEYCETINPEKRATARNDIERRRARTAIL